MRTETISSCVAPQREGFRKRCTRRLNLIVCINLSYIFSGFEMNKCKCNCQEKANLRVKQHLQVLHSRAAVVARDDEISKASIMSEAHL